VPPPLGPPEPPVATPFSITVAMIVTSLLSETVVVTGNMLMTVPVGARSGTLSQAATKASGNRRSGKMARRCVTISGANNNNLMGLRGQDGRRADGYAMAALLVAL